MIFLKSRSTQFYFIICIGLIFTACRTPRYIYSPSPANNPYFREKGESKLAAYYSNGGDYNDLESEFNKGYDLQAAYAISDKWAITADYFKRNEKDNIFNYDRTYFDSSVVRYRRNFTTFGAGYFFPLTKDKKIIMNLFGGFGPGKLVFHDAGIDDNSINYNRDYTNKLFKWYFQPSVNFFPGNYFRTGLISKMTFVHYNNAITNYTNNEMNYLGLDKLEKNTIRILELTWNMQVTFKNLKWFYLDGGFTVSSDPFDNSTNVEARNFNASIGIFFDFSKLNKENKKD